MEEQSEALHAHLTWKDLQRVAESSRSHPHPAQLSGMAPVGSCGILEHRQAGNASPAIQPRPGTLRHWEIEPQIPNML